MSAPVLGPQAGVALAAEGQGQKAVAVSAPRQRRRCWCRRSGRFAAVGLAAFLAVAAARWHSGAYRWGKEHEESVTRLGPGRHVHAEGLHFDAEGPHCHAEGPHLHAEGQHFDVEGLHFDADALHFHAEGLHSYAEGLHFHAEGPHLHDKGPQFHVGVPLFQAQELYFLAEDPHLYDEGPRFDAERQYFHAEGPHFDAEGEHFHVEAPHLHADGPHFDAEGWHFHYEGPHLHVKGPHLHTEGPHFHVEGTHLHDEGPQLDPEGPHFDAERLHLHAEGCADLPQLVGIDTYSGGAVQHLVLARLLPEASDEAKVDGDDEELMEESKALDRDGTGFIAAAELWQVLANWGKELTYEEADEAILVADVDGDVQINYEEFVQRELAVEFGGEEDAEVGKTAMGMIAMMCATRLRASAMPELELCSRHVCRVWTKPGLPAAYRLSQVGSTSVRNATCIVCCHRSPIVVIYDVARVLW